MFTMIQNILKNISNRPATRKYPFVKREPFAATRGNLQLDADVCIYCGICAKQCPSNAITVNREPKNWTVDPYKCIMCGYCVEKCPKKCLKMGGVHWQVNA